MRKFLNENVSIKIMLKVRGKIENGRVLALEPVDDYEGKDVIITLDEEREAANTEGWEKLFTVLKENQMDAEVSDLAHQHDHYLYSTPKRED